LKIWNDGLSSISKERERRKTHRNL